MNGPKFQLDLMTNCYYCFHDLISLVIDVSMSLNHAYSWMRGIFLVFQILIHPLTVFVYLMPENADWILFCI